VRVLALDTSSEVGAVAVVVDGALRAAISARVQAQHGETLLPLVERALALADVPVATLDLLAVGLGPGSFTGVRIGVATAKGLSLARGTPMVGVRTSRILARASSGAVRAVVIDAKKDEVFVAAYRARPDGTLEALLEDAHGPPSAALDALVASLGDHGGEPVRVVGSGVAPHEALLRARLGTRALLEPAVLAAPSAALLALEATEALAARGPDDPSALVPIYVRAADAKLPG
jgi:tRNA threonylcarbamoyladenosine biosynthesis protein TsaB